MNGMAPEDAALIAGVVRRPLINESHLWIAQQLRRIGRDTRRQGNLAGAADDPLFRMVALNDVACRPQDRWHVRAGHMRRAITGTQKDRPVSCAPRIGGPTCP